MASTQVAERRLALLIGAPGQGEETMHADVQAMYDALRLRQVDPAEIMVLEGRLTCGLVRSFLGDARSRIARWSDGSVLLHYSGHGAYRPEDATEEPAATPGVLTEPGVPDTADGWLPWGELWTALDAPASVTVTVLPDC